MVRRHQQLLDETVWAAEAQIDDHVAIVFTAAQLYVRRVQEVVRWFKGHEGGRFGLKQDYASATNIRRLGATIIGDLTIADCAWALGNYAKHVDEVEGLKDPATLDALTKLGAFGPDVPVREAYDRALTKIVGKDSSAAQAALGEIVAGLKGWSRGLFETIADDLDEHEYKERGRTRRESEAFRRALSTKADG